MKMDRALIFDLDGTLWDATFAIRDAWDEAGKRFFGPQYELTHDAVQGLMGKTMDEIANELIPQYADRELAQRFIDSCFQIEVDYLSKHPGALFPNEVPVLSELARDYDLYIVSNCQAGYIETFLPLVPKGLFKGHMCWSDTKLDKRFTLKALVERYGLVECVYIGDTEKDERETHAAGLPFIYASYGFGGAINPEGVASSFKELPPVVAKVFADKKGLGFGS